MSQPRTIEEVLAALRVVVDDAAAASDRVGLFASVYRQFKTLDDLVQEAKAVIDAQHYDVPGQGRLFVEPAAATNGKTTNGEEEGAKKGKRGKAKADKTAPAD